MSHMTRLLLEQSLTARDFCVAMWCASKAGIAEADEYKKDPTSQSGKFHDHLPQHLPNYNTDHLHDLHPTTFNKKTLLRDEHRLSVAPRHECLDDDVENDGTMIFKLEEAKSQNNLSPRFWSHKVVLDNRTKMESHVPMATRSSDFGWRIC